MRSTIDRNLAAVLEAIEDITPAAPGLPVIAADRPSRDRPVGVLVGSFVAVLLLVGVGALLAGGLGRGGDTATTPGAVALPRYTIALDGWRVATVSDDGQSSNAIFTTDDGDGAILVVRKSGRDGAVTGSDLTGEPLGTVEVVGKSATAYRYDDGESRPSFQFYWQARENVTGELIVFTADFEGAELVASSVVAIAESDWLELVAEYGVTEMVTTTMPPGAPLSEPPADPVTTTTMP